MFKTTMCCIGVYSISLVVTLISDYIMNNTQSAALQLLPGVFITIAILSITELSRLVCYKKQHTIEVDIQSTTISNEREDGIL